MTLIKSASTIFGERVAECCVAVRNQSKDSCLPIFGLREDETMYHIGSGTLLHIDKRDYFLTASHIFDHHKDGGLLIPGEKTLLEMLGDVRQTSRVNGSRSQDKLDFGWIDITDWPDSELSKSRFLTDFCFNQLDQPGRAYIAMGYPNSRNKPIHGARFAKTELHTYGSIGRHEINHIFIQFAAERCRNSAGEIAAAANPRGMSGGPLFDVGNLTSLDNINSKPQGRLAAVITEHLVATEEIMTTKIQVVVDAILYSKTHR